MSTPASPARMLDRIHAISDTRSELIPWSCTSRGLSTTARMRRPSPPPRKSNVNATTTIAVEMRVAIWPASRT